MPIPSNLWSQHLYSYQLKRERKRRRKSIKLRMAINCDENEMRRIRINCVTNRDISLTKHNFFPPSSTYETNPLNVSPTWYADKSHSQSLMRKQTLSGEFFMTSLKMSSSSDDINISIFALNDSKIWQQIDNKRIFRWISWWSVEFETQSQIFWNCIGKMKWNFQCHKNNVHFIEFTYKFAQHFKTGNRFLTFTEHHFPINLELILEKFDHFVLQINLGIKKTLKINEKNALRIEWIKKSCECHLWNTLVASANDFRLIKIYILAYASNDLINS